MSLDFMRVPFGAEPALFADRVDAGRQLGQALRRFRGERPLVLGIPRGGVPVAAEVARALDADLDVIVSRTLRTSASPQLVAGAVTADGACCLHHEVIDHLNVPEEDVDAEIEAKRAEADQNERRLRGGTPPVPIANRTVIVVDDGLATGSTMIAAARSIRARRPEKLIIAVPVAPRATCDAMREEADDFVCLEVPDSFIAIPLHYRDFPITQDEEVARILDSWRPMAATRAR